MARSPRNNQPDSWHHVMNQGVDRNDVFLGDIDRHTFEQLMQQLHDEHQVEIHAYCLMGNHYHFIGRSGAEGISAGMQQLASSFTRIVNERTGRVGPLFRGRFTSVTIESDEQLLNTVAYVHRNPIDLVPVAAISAYRWSSYGVYLGKRAAPAWLTTSFVSALLTPDEHRRLVDSGVQVVPESSIPRDRIVEALRGYDDVGPGSVRSVSLVVSAGIGRCSTEELVRRFDFTSPQAARMAVSRARRRCGDSDELARLVSTVESSLGGVTPGV